jgi:hypothetical protein
MYGGMPGPYISGIFGVREQFFLIFVNIAL